MSASCRPNNCTVGNSRFNARRQPSDKRVMSFLRQYVCRPASCAIQPPQARRLVAIQPLQARRLVAIQLPQAQRLAAIQPPQTRRLAAIQQLQIPKHSAASPYFHRAASGKRQWAGIIWPEFVGYLLPARFRPGFQKCSLYREWPSCEIGLRDHFVNELWHIGHGVNHRGRKGRHVDGREDAHKRSAGTSRRYESLILAVAWVAGKSARVEGGGGEKSSRNVPCDTQLAVERSCCAPGKNVNTGPQGSSASSSSPSSMRGRLSGDDICLPLERWRLAHHGARPSFRKHRSRSLTGGVYSGAGMKGRGKREIPEKTRRPTASSGTVPTCENPVTRPGIEPGWWPLHTLQCNLPNSNAIKADATTGVERSPPGEDTRRNLEKPHSLAIILQNTNSTHSSCATRRQLSTTGIEVLTRFVLSIRRRTAMTAARHDSARHR
ncbi:hypothetical protein PR048_027884 [Dryococelus australis]|uniref:Uncharacterized protein n=1 Tax=Dryococelus australis TaxID=614101 RepID=A0ABQ9GHQ4_9NEOP|nr:hypothetical protein PR048_027884 [Dryococelus australis]